MTLSSYTQGRDNNFNFIRILAAFAVLITHSFALTIGSGEAEPFRNTLGMTMGSIAVDVFFVMSGFLVTASLFTRQSAIEFIWARILRIYPALLVMLFLTVVICGFFFTKLPVSAYFIDASTMVYLVKSITLIAGVGHSLPGVFTDNPFRYSVNGSLWTMPFEVRMYAILIVAWIALRVAKDDRRKIFETIVVISTIFSGILLLMFYFCNYSEGYFLRLFFMFFSGASFYVLRDRIIMSATVFWLIVSAILVSGLINKHIFFVIFTLTIAYVILFLAYVPAGRIRKYNQLGDYSYGVYIYAFPVQQSMATLFKGISVFPMILVSFFITFIFAIISWHLIEKRALMFKGGYVNHTRKIFNSIKRYC